MPKMKLTAQAIKGLEAEPGQSRTDFQDLTVPGLILRVSASGKKSYSVSYWKRGKRPRVTLAWASEEGHCRFSFTLAKRLTPSHDLTQEREALALQLQETNAHAGRDTGLVNAEPHHLGATFD